MQRLAVIGVGQFVLCLPAGFTGRPCPARQLGAGEIFHDMLRSLSGDHLLVAFPRKPLAVGLENTELPRGQTQRQQVAAAPQIAFYRARRGYRQRARAGQDEQIITFGRQQRFVGQNGGGDELSGVADGPHLGGDLLGERWVTARQVFGDDRRLWWLRS